MHTHKHTHTPFSILKSLKKTSNRLV
uniref:Uncharacterized protein n=1 Tax=Anguilla anguilla TaxID=7936 RepID=A0A0E9TXX1_ANGAN